ncbi:MULTISPECIES: sensor histidine kinase [unclassified Paenibacillus]|uniref:cache domain-containing sensor histidine kinase n=1 Tax=unclassified Paenibacillus TaxID=185978 RepID=UPI0015A22E23|nr:MULTISPECIES: sensor histidine kinase [unclassified Paenibacillus]
MILIMLAVSIIPLLMLAYISITASSSTVEKQVNRLNAQLVNQLIDRIELSMNRFRELSVQYSGLFSIQNALVSPSELYYEDVVLKRELISVLSTASAMIGNVEGLQVYSAVTGEILSSTEAPSRIERSIYKPLIDHFLSSPRTELFLDKDSMPGMEMLRDSSIYMARIPYNKYEEMKGIILISMKNNQFQQQIENIQLGSRGSITLLTPAGSPIATTSKLSDAEDKGRVETILEHWRELGSPNQFAEASSIISVKQTGTYDGWIVVSEIPSKELTQSTGIIRDTVVYFLAVLIGLGAASILGFGYHLYRPLQAVKRQVNAIKKGQFDARVDTFANNEIGDLGRMLNSMAIRIQELVNDLQDSEELKRRLEIRALQSQINPHFMYNTLNTIRMFAMLKDYDKINTLMGRFVGLLRYSMENYDQTVKLGQELDYLKDYVGLLNMRYKCQIVLDYDIEEPLGRMQIPKLSLQPLIENSVFHGILPKKSETGHIAIRAFANQESERIVIEIRDDGLGLPEEELEKLRMHLLREESSENIGLQNVRMRLKLMFGQSTAMELFSEEGAGLLIRIELQADQIQIKEEEHERL